MMILTRMHLWQEFKEKDYSEILKRLTKKKSSSE